MGVNGPVGEDDVGLLSLQELAHLVVPGRVDLGRAIDLPREDRARLEDLARFETLRRADGGGLVVAFSGNSRLTAREVDSNHLMPQLGESSHRSATTRFGIVGMAAHDDQFGPVSRILAARDHGRGNCGKSRRQHARRTTQRPQQLAT